MGASGLLIKKDPKNFEPILGNMGDWESYIRRGETNADIEHAALFTSTGEPIVGYRGDEHSVSLDEDHLNRTHGGTLTHYHPDPSFGGTLSMQDLWVFAQSDLNEMRAVTSQGYAYSIKAGKNLDRAKLLSWVNSRKKIMQKNFNNAYNTAIRQATTVLKSGKNKGKVKLVNHTTGKVTYRRPMTREQAVKYARTYATNMYDAMYKKHLKKLGVTYDKAKRRGITPKSNLPVIG